MKAIKSVLIIGCFSFILLLSAASAEVAHDEAGAGNPIVPGYYADPTVRKFGDTFYMYATTDGTGGGTGPSQVWMSKDFVNWTNLPMNWPATKHIWAPDVVKGPDGKYYLYYSQPCQIHAGVSDSPIGPWKSMGFNPDGMIVPNQYMPPVITLDWQIFEDDDARRYGMFCTWAIYDGHGCGMVEVDKNGMPIDSTKGMIPNTQLPDVFEAPYMIKKDGVYYMMYSSGSCHTDTYRVQYATADNIWGPYTYDKVNNPILSTNADGTIHGPGHHSMLEVDGEHYMVYHRHDNPHSNHGMNRQVAADKMEFGPDNTIKKMVPSHKGVGFLGENIHPFENLAFGKKVTVSSYYDEGFKAEYAIDDNNGTLWKASDNSLPQTVEVDLGSAQQVGRTWTQFHYANWYYQYMIEYSLDGKDWKVFSDKRDNRLSGSPMVDFGGVKARYIKLTVTGLEKKGMYAGLWNFKVFAGAKEEMPQLLVHLEADDLQEGPLKGWENNKGMLGGSYEITSGEPVVTIIDGRNAVQFKAGASCKISSFVPETLKENGVYTQAYWVHSKMRRDDDQEQWRFITIVRDGDMVKIYRDGEVLMEREFSEKRTPGGFELPMRFGRDRQYRAASYASMRIYARALHAAEIKGLMEAEYKKPADPSPEPQGLLVDLNTSDLKIGVLKEWENKGLASQKFIAENSGPMVEVVAGVKAVTFKGADSFKSTFKSPATLEGNGNYTVAVWAYNPDVSETEIMLSWSRHGDLEATGSKLGYGSQSARGAMVHFGWADVGYKTIPEVGKWHHIAVTFDGTMEKVYVDGKLDVQEEKMMFATGANEIFIGKGHGAPEFFSGSLASVVMYDKALSVDKIAEMASDKPSSDVLMSIDSSKLDYGSLKAIDNKGSLGGAFKAGGYMPTVKNVDGKIAVVFDGNGNLTADVAISEMTDYSISALVNCKDSKNNHFAWWHYGELIPAMWVLDSSISGWQHIVFTSKGGMYLNGRPLAAIAGRMPERKLHAGQVLILGNGFKGAIADITLFGKVLTESEIADVYVAATGDLQGPVPASFDKAPGAIDTSSVKMSAKRSTDASGSVEYNFVEVSGNPGGKSSGWIKENSYENFGLKTDTEYKYKLCLRDYFGNVSFCPDVLSVKTDSDLFVEYYDDFSSGKDYLADGTGGTMWDGLITKGEKDMVVKTARAWDGILRLESTSAWWDEPQRGPFLYKIVKGDFVAEAKVADVQGWDQKKAQRMLEPDLMIRVADIDKAGEGEDLVRTGLFPYWNCGNLWTSKDGHGRPQGNNQTGYNADRYLQIERSGEWIYVRTSSDGKAWKSLPGTPLHRADMANLPLQVGLAQTIAKDGITGWVDFDWFKLTLRK
jgi:hypothetical protein